MSIKITDWRVSHMLDTSVPNVASYPHVFGIEGRVDGHGWVGMAREDDGNKHLTFPTYDEAAAEVSRLKAALPAPTPSP